MDVLWEKGQTKDFSNETITLSKNALGDGDTYSGCCRLCGKENTVRNFQEPYIWEGVEDTYDKLLYRCFGVRVSSSDCKICDWCIRQLRNTQRFRSLVLAAFDKTSTECSNSQKHIEKCHKPKPEEPDPTKQLRELLKPRHLREKVCITKNGRRKTNLACTICKQKYPMMVPFEGWENFVCSRCKMNSKIKMSICRKCNIVVQSSMLEEHMKKHKLNSDLRGKSRLYILPKNLQKPEFVRSKNKCSKKIHVLQNLRNDRPHCVNRDKISSLCKETRPLWNQHMQINNGRLHNCDACSKIKRTPQIPRVYLKLTGNRQIGANVS